MVIVAEIKFSEIAVQVFFLAMPVNALHAPLYKETATA
jgi:hypothetical protein